MDSFVAKPESAKFRPTLTRKQYERLSTCAICKSQAQDHRVLPCQHLFCKVCLQGILNGRNIVCPTCGEVCRLKGALASSLPQNVFLLALIENMCLKCMQRNKEVLCEPCDKWFCLTCHELCINQHKQDAERKIAEVVSLEERNLAEIDEERRRVNEQADEALAQIKQFSTNKLDDLEIKMQQIKDKFDAIKLHQKHLQEDVTRYRDEELARLDVLWTDATHEMEQLTTVRQDVAAIPAQDQDTDQAHDALRRSKELTQVKWKIIGGADITFNPKTRGFSNGRFGNVKYSRVADQLEPEETSFD